MQLSLHLVRLRAVVQSRVEPIDGGDLASVAAVVNSPTRNRRSAQRRTTVFPNVEWRLGKVMVDREQWRKDVERWGRLRALHIRVMSSLKRWLTVCRIHSRTLDLTARTPDLPEGYSVRVATRHELLRAAQDPVMGLRPASIDAALERGDICAAAFDRDRMVAYTWRSFSTAPHVDGLWVTFERPYRYGYKGFTHPDYRGQHLPDALVYLTEATCIERGYTRGLSFVETHNFASIAQGMRRGNRVVGWAGYVKLFGRVYPFRTPGARKHTFRFVRSQQD